MPNLGLKEAYDIYQGRSRRKMTYQGFIYLLERSQKVIRVPESSHPAVDPKTVNELLSYEKEYITLGDACRALDKNRPHLTYKLAKYLEDKWSQLSIKREKLNELYPGCKERIDEEAFKRN